jgi:N-acetyl sugar amidotransferase
MKWCINCLNTDTRPRIIFNKKGVCNACLWAEEKKKIDWSKRIVLLSEIIENVKRKKKEFDVIIPVSGGKDGSYVAYILKNKYKLNPLCVTIHPPLRTDLGYKNLENFKKNQTNLIEINLPYQSHMLLNKYGLINHGRPLYGWLISIFSAVFKIAHQFDVKLIFYGEEGEVEYGGTDNLKNEPFFNLDFIKNIYLSNEYNKTLNSINIKDRYWWSFDNLNKDIKFTHWSFFENWDPYRNYIYAKKYFNYTEKETKNIGTYTNFSQNDTYLYDLHSYLMYLKFGFGRCTQDIGIDIRRGSLSRSQGIELANMYDSENIFENVNRYCEYFKMKEKEFFKTIDKFANKKLFNKKKKIWSPKFRIK